MEQTHTLFGLQVLICKIILEEDLEAVDMSLNYRKMNGGQSLLIFKIDVLLIPNFIENIFNVFNSAVFGGKHERGILPFINFLQISSIFDQKFHGF